MMRQFTATCYVIQNEKVLLIYHKKLKTWLPPGGHMEPNETPPEACKREVLEETGLEIEFIKQENLFMTAPMAKSFERPYFCSLQDVPAYKDQPAHQHMDLIYLAIPVGGKEIENPEETNGLKWFTLDEVLELTVDVDIFKDTQDAIQHILRSQFAVL